MLTSTVYSSSLVGVAVDEVHCVTQWGLSNSNRWRTAFRKWYSRLNELRSLTSSNVPVMALTATATNNTKVKIYELLELRNPCEVKINPDRSNITYVVQKMVRDLGIAEHFTSICEDIEKTAEKQRERLFTARRYFSVLFCINHFLRHLAMIFTKAMIVIPKKEGLICYIHRLLLVLKNT